jgi:NlpC/P60 family protein
MHLRISGPTFVQRAGRLVLVVTLGAGVLWAQAGKSSRQHSPAAARQVAPSGLVNSDEGLSILAAALESRHHADSRLDCSHLIHAIYERAGFPYSYANSSDLYDGAEDFRQVTRPQTGDLIVWRGHVGIVISGEQHTFFSALRTGRGVETYDSKYWKRRGRPRFFRYIRESPALAASPTRVGLKLAGLENAGSRETADPVATASDEMGDRESPSVAAAVAEPPIPRVQAIHSSRPKPEDVSKALLPTYDAVAQALESHDLLNASQRVVVFDSLTVRKVQLKHDQGWAEVQIDGPVPLVALSSSPKKRSERQHWGLVRKDRDTWELAFPADVIYLSRDAGARVVAHQLTALTDTDPKGNRERKVQLAEMLNALLRAAPAR